MSLTPKEQEFKRAALQLLPRESYARGGLVEGDVEAYAKAAARLDDDAEALIDGMLPPIKTTYTGVGNITKTGTGAAILGATGPYTGETEQTYEIEIDSTDAGSEIGQATFRWRLSGDETWAAEGVLTSSSLIDLGQDGVRVKWLAWSGQDFVVGDSWTLTAGLPVETLECPEWALPDWERVYGLPSTGSYELRNARLLAAIRRRLGVKPGDIQEALRPLLGYDPPVIEQTLFRCDDPESLTDIHPLVEPEEEVYRGVILIDGELAQSGDFSRSEVEQIVSDTQASGVLFEPQFSGFFADDPYSLTDTDTLSA